MKVLQINSVCGIGSTGRIATDIHQILEAQGHESWIAYGRGEAINCSNTIKIGNKLDNYKHVALTRIFDLQGFGSVQATKDFIKEIEFLDPDVIHLHNLHGYYLNIEILFNYLKRANKPVIWTLHDCWSFTGHCSHFDYVGCERWKIGCYNCPEKKMYPGSLLMDNSQKNYHSKKEIFTGIKNLTIISPSEWLAKEVKESFLGEYPIQVINNGIDLNLFKPTEGEFRKTYNLENKFIILGVASIWTERKGVNFFIELAKELTKDEIIILVGLTQNQKNKLPKNIIGITRTNNIKELAEIYTTADVFLNPTLEDTFPTTNLESIACGTPVITFNTGGSPECISEETGRVIEKSDLNSLKERIEYLKTNIKMFNDDVLRKTAVSKYNKEDKYNEYISFYKK